MIDLLVDRAQMRKLVHQGFEAVAPRAPAYKNRLAILQCHSAYATAKYLLDYGFANHIDLPAVRHWLRPDAGPSFTRQLGYILAPDRSFETSHLTWADASRRVRAAVDKLASLPQVDSSRLAICSCSPANGAVNPVLPSRSSVLVQLEGRTIALSYNMIPSIADNSTDCESGYSPAK
jgi:hypothetical protein